MKSFNYLYLLIIASVSLLLSACGGGLSKTSTLSGGEGLVLIKIMSNSVLNDPDFPYWHTMTIKRTDTKTANLITVTPNANLQGYTNTLTFARPLPEGKYVISTLSSNSKTNPNTLLIKKFGIAFEVKSGQFTNVGNIIYQPQGNLTARKTFSIGHDVDDEGAKSLVQKHFPAVAKQVLAKPILHMRESAARDQRFRNVAQHAKANSAVLNNPVFNNKGHIYAGARFGQVLRKVYDWERLDTGYNREISTVLPLGDKKILAGGEDGLLILSNDNGNSWNPVSVPVANSWIFFSAKTNKGEILISSIQEGQAAVYKTTSIESPNWEKLKEFSVNTKDLNKSLPQISVTSERLIVVTNSVNYYDFASNNWSSYSIPFDVEDIGQQIKILDDGTILGYRLSDKMNRVYKTNNLGKSWDKQGASPNISSMIFIDGQTGYTLTPNPGAPAEKLVLRTSDGGKTWSKASEAPKLINPQLHADQFNQLLYMIGASGKVYISSDFAQSWSPIRNVAWFE